MSERRGVPKAAIADNPVTIAMLPTDLSGEIGAPPLTNVFEGTVAGHLEARRYDKSDAHDDYLHVHIASPEMFPKAEMLPHLICPRPTFIGGANDEADQHGGA
jgi:hypothetical protein